MDIFYVAPSILSKYIKQYSGTQPLLRLQLPGIWSDWGGASDFSSLPSEQSEWQVFHLSLYRT